MTKPELKDLFLSLTETTVPFGYEETLEYLLPMGFKRDSVGNYYYEIGRSETLFTTHLDTYSKDFVPITRYQDTDDEYVIFTDGETILGGDNKLGCCILIGMIQNRVPGTYYFFLGEEPITSGGLWGSSRALRANPGFFRKFKRCVAFDRRGYGSVVIRQMARMSASREFVEAIAAELRRLGKVEFDDKSSYGYYTDTATFMDVIPECTNISAGGFNEHHTNEWVDLNYTYRVLQAALQVDWDNLPVRREIENRYRKSPSDTGICVFIGQKLIDEMSDIEEFHLTRDYFDGYNRRLTFSTWLQDLDIDVWISKSGKVFMDKDMKETLSVSEVVSRFKRMVTESDS
jgi:hypothetical protein